MILTIEAFEFNFYSSNMDLSLMYSVTRTSRDLRVLRISCNSDNSALG
jgi:hypothetical protein